MVFIVLEEFCKVIVFFVVGFEMIMVLIVVILFNDLFNNFKVLLFGWFIWLVVVYVFES